MRRFIVAAAAAGLLAATLAGPSAAAEARVLEASARGSVWAGLIDVQPSFDPAFADSISTASSVGTSSLNSIVWPSFLADAMFFLYEEQFRAQTYERMIFAISNAGWPQGPEDADATLTKNLPEAVPGRGGRSIAHAGSDGASGEVALLATAPLEDSIVSAAASSSKVVTKNGVASAYALQQATQISVGPLVVGLVRGEVSAEAGKGAQPTATSDLVVTGATIAGVPVEITEEGARAGSDTLQGLIDTALGDRGLTVRLLPASKDLKPNAASISSGGMLVRFHVEATDPLGTPRNATLGMLFGNATASARAEPLPAPPIAVPGPTDVVRPPSVNTVVVPGSVPPPSLAAPLVRRRTILTRATAEAGDARGLYGAVVLAALGLLFVRPLVRVASRT